MARCQGAHTQGIMATIRGSLLILDQDLRVVQANDAFCSTFQVPMDRTIGRHCAAIH